MTDDSIGIDISKDQLAAFRLSDGAERTFANSSAGLRALRRWIGRRMPARVVFEATGPYHRRLERELGGRLPLVKVNPCQARHFARARGARARTDPLDARMLAQMGAALNLQPDPPEAQDQRELRALAEARRALVAERTRLKNRRHAQMQDRAPGLIIRQIDAMLGLVARQIAALEQAIAARVRACPRRARAEAILRSIPGIGPTASALILAHLPQIGRLERRQVAALAGLAPMTRQSGTWRGRARIAGGRKALRDALYMPAVVASRANPDLARKYAALVAAGKPPKLALACLMRKLIELANALVKADREWQPNAP